MRSSQSDSTITSGRRKKLTTIVFDTDFFFRPKTRLLIKKAGIEAPTIYMAAICWMAYEESSPYLSSEAIELLAADLGIDNETVENVLTCCHTVGLLEIEDGVFYSERLAVELGILQTKQKNYSAGALKREAAKRGKSEQDSAKSSKIEQNPAALTKTEQVRKEQEQEKEEEQEEETDQDREPRSLPSASDDDPETWSPFRREAEEALQPVTDAISRAPGFVALRRRPMRKYPELWLTGAELATVTERILEAGITLGDRPSVFAKASAHAKKQIASGKEPSLMNAYGWLLGFCLTATIDEQTKSTQLATSEQYLRNARKK